VKDLFIVLDRLGLGSDDGLIRFESVISAMLSLEVAGAIRILNVVIAVIKSEQRTDLQIISIENWNQDGTFISGCFCDRFSESCGTRVVDFDINSKLGYWINAILDGTLRLVCAVGVVASCVITSNGSIVAVKLAVRRA
jgi:hypothetical protein